MSLYRDEAVVLRTMRLGEADRIITFVTKTRGKVRAVAKGIRRTNSKFGGRLEPLGHVAMQCWHGRELDTVTQVETIDSFRGVREDLQRVARAFTLLEIVDQIAQERHPNERLYEMLVGALRFLDTRDSVLIVPAFCLRVLDLEGSAPVVDRCASCSAETDLVAFDLMEGGALCRSCRRGRAISPAALDVLRRISGGAIAPVLAEPAGPVTDEVTDLGTEAMEVHLERRLRSLRSSPA
jgi:DNA repair protein RecO (recombination protein O)